MKLLIAAAFTLALVGPVHAAVPVPVMKVMGADFYSRCTSPPAARGAQTVGICAAYVAGITDDLIDSSKVCLGAQATPAVLLPFTLNWIKNHMQNGGYPAALQIRTGLMTAFPCRATSRTPSTRKPSAADTMAEAIKLGSQWVALWNEAKPLLLAILH